MMSQLIFFTNRVKWYVKLDWIFILVVKFWPLLVCCRVVYEFLWNPSLLPSFIFCQLLPQISIIIQCQEYAIFWFLLLLFHDPSVVLLVLYYNQPLWEHYVWCWTWIQEDKIWQGILSCIYHKIHFYGGNNDLKIQFIPWQFPVCIFLVWFHRDRVRIYEVMPM